MFAQGTAKGQLNVTFLHQLITQPWRPRQHDFCLRSATTNCPLVFSNVYHCVEILQLIAHGLRVVCYNQDWQKVREVRRHEGESGSLLFNFTALTFVLLHKCFSYKHFHVKDQCIWAEIFVSCTLYFEKTLKLNLLGKKKLLKRFFYIS